MYHYRPQKIPDIPIDAKRCPIDGYSSDSEEEEFFTDGNESENYYRSFSEDSSEPSEPSLPVRSYPNEYSREGAGQRKYPAGRRPPCGLQQMAYQQRQRLTYQKQAPSTTSSSTNESHEDPPMPKYSVPNKRHHRVLSPPQRYSSAQLEMIQELSPIQPCAGAPASSPRGEFASPPVSYKMQMFKPKHTSSVINAPAATITRTTRHMLPPRMPVRNSNSLDLQPYNELLMRHQEDLSSDSSHFDGPLSRPRGGLTSSSPKRGHSQKPIRPEDFGLPAPIAFIHKAKGEALSSGIVFLRVLYSRKNITIWIKRAEYFSKSVPGKGGAPDYIRRNLSSYIQLELVHRSREERDRKRASSKMKIEQDYSTKTVENTDRPEFKEAFTFPIDERNRHDLITITAIEEIIHNYETRSIRPIGRFTFCISKLIQKAKQAGYRDGDKNLEVIKSGFFLLDSEKGLSTNFNMANITHKTNYCVEGPHSSSSSLNGQSPQKMLRSSATDWLASHMPSRSSSAIPPANINEHRGRARPISYVEGHRFSEDILPSMESFENSGSSSIDYDFNRHRMTLPSITTTSSSMTSDEGPSCSTSSSAFNPSFLCPGGDGEGKGTKGGEDGDRKPSRQEGGVRRAASFTYSPTGSLGKHNRRPEAVVGKKEEPKNSLFGPITKTFSFLRSKVDAKVGSTSSLYPTKEEVLQWETSFETLLNNKYGQMLFSQFLVKEFCSENIEFWLACEELKKMKEGKKSTTAMAHEIFRKFVAEGAPREVNLDSDTRAATKGAMEGAGGCRTDTFNLAQGKIEHLMATDKYRRFLKDKLYLDMLHHAEGKEEPAENGGAK